MTGKIRVYSIEGPSQDIRFLVVIFNETYLQATISLIMWRFAMQGPHKRCAGSVQD